MSDLLTYELTKTQKAIRVAMDHALAALEITTPQYGVLAAVQAVPGASAAELARQSFHTPQTINEVVAHLEAAALIERRPHPTHGRIRQILLTAEGQQVLDSAKAAAHNIDARLTAELTSTERTHLFELLRRCAAALAAGDSDAVPG